jgi:hypothetical protein
VRWCGGLAPQITLDHYVLVNGFADPRKLVLHQLMNSALARNSKFLAKVRRRRATDTVDIGQRDFDALLRRDVDASYTCHAWNSFFPAPKQTIDRRSSTRPLVAELSYAQFETAPP